MTVDPLVLGTHIVTLAAALGWLWVVAGLGDAVQDRLGYRPPEPALQVAHAVALGAAAAGTGLLGLLLVGLFRPWIVIIGVAALTWVVRDRLGRVARSLRAVAHAAANQARADRANAVALVALAMLAAGAALLTVAPITDWDSLMYHVDLPAELLARGRLHLPADNLHISRIGLAQLLHGVPLAVGLPSATAGVTLGFGLALALGAYGLAERWTPTAGPFAAACTWGSAMLLIVATTPRVDTHLALFLLLASGTLASAQTVKPALWTVGILLGAAFATKFLAGPYMVVLGVVALAVAGPGAAARLRAGAVVAGVATLFALPWLLKNVLVLGAPLYPFLTEAVPPPWITELAAAEGASAPKLTVAQFDWIWSVRAPFSLRDFVLAPARLTIEQEGRFYFASPILIFLPLLAIRRRQPLLLLALPGLVFVATLAGFLPGLNLRYLLPGLVTLVLAAGITAFRATSSRRWLRIGILVAALAPGFAALGLQIERTGAAAHAAGLVTPTRYRLNHPQTTGLVWAAATVARHVPTDGLVLMLFEARGFGFPRAVLQDNKATNWSYLSGTSASERCLAGSGISHVLVNGGALNYYVQGGLDPALLEWDTFNDFERRCLTRTAAALGFTLYRVQ